MSIQTICNRFWGIFFPRPSVSSQLPVSDKNLIQQSDSRSIVSKDKLISNCVKSVKEINNFEERLALVEELLQKRPNEVLNKKFKKLKSKQNDPYIDHLRFSYEIDLLFGSVASNYLRYYEETLTLCPEDDFFLKIFQINNQKIKDAVFVTCGGIYAKNDKIYDFVSIMKKYGGSIRAFQELIDKMLIMNKFQEAYHLLRSVFIADQKLLTDDDVYEIDTWFYRIVNEALQKSQLDFAKQVLEDIANEKVRQDAKRLIEDYFKR